MSSEIAIKVDAISKCYHIYDKPRDRLLQMFARGRKKYFREFWALQKMSFEIRRGETVGIIGRNGSGKSTLLQMICGTLNPTTGSIQTNGRVAALLELGSGFNPEFTGRENVFMNASVLGLTTEETVARFDKIVEFADIGDFVEQPVKTYSSGMMVRLAFAVIAHVNADILIIDEALAVGDAFFTQKCMRFLREFMENGTVLFVSHDTAAVVNLCSTAILLDSGIIAMSGNPKEVAENYLAKLYEGRQGLVNVVVEEKQTATSHSDEYRDCREPLVNKSLFRNDVQIFRFNPGEMRGFGIGGALVVGVRLFNVSGVPLSWVVGGEDVCLEIRCRANQDLSSPIVGFHFKDRLGQVIFADNTFLEYQMKMPYIRSGENFVARFDFRMPVLPSGDYSISPAIAEGSQEDHVQHHWIHDGLILRVHASAVTLGLVGLPMRKIQLSVENGVESV